MSALNIGYADPPYPGQSKLYKNHVDYAGEVDHESLIDSLEHDYDGWVLHTSSVALGDILDLVSHYADHGTYRVMAWVKPFAAFKRNVSVAYAWEPVIVKSARKPTVRKGMGFTYRDWLDESITLKRGLTGAKPERVCHWLFETVGAEPSDKLDDMFPGTGAVSRAWDSWKMLRSSIEEGWKLTLNEETA